MLFILILSFLQQIECARILGIFHVPGVSHHRAGVSLMEILASRGHEVTFLSPFEEENVPKNFKSVVMRGIYNESSTDEIFRDIDNLAKRYSLIKDPIIVEGFLSGIIGKTLQNEDFKKFMSSGEKFDAVVLEEFGSLALRQVVHHFKAPLILFSGIDLNPYISEFLGSPDNPSYISHFHLHLTNQMTFYERIQSTVHYVLTKIVMHYVTIPSQNEMLHKNFPNSPEIETFVKNVSLVLVNTHPSVYEPIPRVPKIISIGGYHIKKTKPLPKDLQELLDKADEGVIYFSFGSNLKSKFISDERKNLMIKTFAKLNQTVLWKFEEDLPNKPDNLILRKWFPQNDILAHKNIKLFISHGGIYSMMESVHHGVPMLLFPMFGDQFGNVKRAEAMKFGKGMLLSDLKGDVFERTIRELLDNPQYTISAQQRSRIFRDEPISAADKINYWVEYVIRHKGAEHLSVASTNLSLYQLLLLDVMSFILVIILLIIILMKFMISFIVRKSSNVPSTVPKTKQN